MFSNLGPFLSSSLKILNIADRALPLFREISPTIKSIKTFSNKLKGINIPNTINKTITKPKSIPNNISKPQNSLTFFN